MLGPKSLYADECRSGNFIGADHGIQIDLTNDLSDDLREFNHKFIPIYLADKPEKTRVAAGLACGAVWTICKSLNIGDVILSPNGHRQFLVGEIAGDYSYHPGEILPHRRPVKWYPVTIRRSELSEKLRRSTTSQGPCIILTNHAEEIESFISGHRSPGLISPDKTIEDLSVFGMEKHLEEFLIENWHQTDLGKLYDIFEIEGEIVGQQFQCDTGFIDILAISKDKKVLVVIELKKGRASDTVVGQIQRYMGYVKDELAEPGQSVKGIIIAWDDDKKIKRALSVTPNIDLYRYKVSFILSKQ